MTTTQLSIPTRGPFSLAEAATFGFGHQDVRDYDGVARLAFRVDGPAPDGTGRYEALAAVAVRQRGESLDLDIETTADPNAVARQVARILSVDVDGHGFVDLGRRDPVIGALQAVAPGLRPPLFHSPYEAAAWGIVSARRSRTQGMAIRERLAAAYGSTIEVAGRMLPVFPAPSRLADVTGVPGLPDLALPRLHAIATAASAGDLDIDRLVAMDPDAAMLDLQRLPGIGPFYSALIVVRACGLPDVMTWEPTAKKTAESLYGLGELDDEAYAAFADRWRPYRTWAIVLIRAAASRLTERPTDAPL